MVISAEVVSDFRGGGDQGRWRSGEVEIRGGGDFRGGGDQGRWRSGEVEIRGGGDQGRWGFRFIFQLAPAPCSVIRIVLTAVVVFDCVDDPIIGAWCSDSSVLHSV